MSALSYGMNRYRGSNHVKAQDPARRLPVVSRFLGFRLVADAHGRVTGIQDFVRQILRGQDALDTGRLVGWGDKARFGHGAILPARGCMTPRNSVQAITKLIAGRHRIAAVHARKLADEKL